MHVCIYVCVYVLLRMHNTPVVDVLKVLLCCRVSDLGGGVPHDIVKKIWKYGFTTGEMDQQSEQKDQLLFQELTENRSGGRFQG